MRGRKGWAGFTFAVVVLFSEYLPCRLQVTWCRPRWLQPIWVSPCQNRCMRNTATPPCDCFPNFRAALSSLTADWSLPQGNERKHWPSLTALGDPSCRTRSSRRLNGCGRRSRSKCIGHQCPLGTLLWSLSACDRCLSAGQRTTGRQSRRQPGPQCKKRCSYCFPFLISEVFGLNCVPSPRPGTYCGYTVASRNLSVCHRT